MRKYGIVASILSITSSAAVDLIFSPSKAPEIARKISHYYVAAKGLDLTTTEWSEDN